MPTVEQLLYELQARFPIRNYRLVVRRRTLRGAHGSCGRSQRQITITLDPKGSPSERLDAIRHEYAHALCFDNDPRYPRSERSAHGAAWGAYYAACYQEFERLFNQE